jgi:carbonic anhydrase
LKGEKRVSRSKSALEKKSKKSKKEKSQKSDKKKAKKDEELKALKRSSKVAKAVPIPKKVTLSGKVLEQENSKKLKIKPFDAFQGMPENWLSDFESAMQKASLDPVQNGIGQVHYFLSEEGMEW